MQPEINAVEGKVDAFFLPVCLICDRVIIGCETVHKLDEKAVLATKSKFSIEKNNSYYLRPAIIGPHPDTYEVVVTVLRGMMVRAASFTSSTIPMKV
jgi:hypothetical protein